ncbi:putative F-box/FBD/LRR-repeat protein At5g56810 [Triticum dicoccoides]|uniref:putative F-box/FBD/LRR-repeat protein At5g56810 n=1 Tax=Triticum dicoccoides TaxID=85692 RepID=UPI001891B7CD|nr:putative F-box/FBD/LRR-repeat protein At5g56810 [Triticum dicoccoides]
MASTTTGKRKGSACGEQGGGDGDSQSGKATRSSIPDLPEDILFRIHSLMPMREAARVACVSRAFFHSWRCHSSLIFNKDTIGLKRSACGENFDHKIDRILRNHSGCLKTFNIDYYGTSGFTGTSYFDRWLQIALKPGIEELTLVLSETKGKYNFPCSLLSDGVRNSLRYLRLRFCALHPPVELGPLRSLKSLYLWRVNITWNELECLISNSLTLELLDLISCPEIECLKLPCALQRLSALSVLACERLKVIESKAPNLSSLYLCGNWLDFSLVETLPIKELELQQTNLIRDARAKLPSLMPNIETLAIQSSREVVDAPMLPTKFLHLKHLTITVRSGAIVSRAYDYFSLVSFLDASPSLETLILDVTQRRMVHESIFADSQLRHMPEHRHGHLKNVKISGFNSAKCVVELTCYILKNAVSLECLTLDTIYGSRCDDQGEDNWCTPMTNGILMEIPWALLAIKTHIENEVPPTVHLTVLEPCSKCHANGLERVLSQS